MTTILVAGATGKIGRRVVTRLLERGDTVRVLSRSAQRAHEMFAAGKSQIEVHEGDVRHEPTLQGIATGVDLMVCTLGTRTFYGNNSSAAVDALGMRNLMAAITGEPSLKQLILLSAFGLDRQSFFLKAFSRIFNQYFRWKAEAERSVRESGIPYTIVRPVEFSFSRKPPRKQAKLNQAEALTLLRNINIELVAETLVACVQHPDAIGKTFELVEGIDQPSIVAQLSSMLPDEMRPLPARTPLC